MTAAINEVGRREQHPLYDIWNWEPLSVQRRDEILHEGRDVDLSANCGVPDSHRRPVVVSPSAFDVDAQSA